MTTRKSTRATRSKAETSSAFEGVRERTEQSEAMPDGERALKKAREAALRGTAESFSLETAVQTLTTAGIGLTGALSELTKKLQDTARQVEELKEVKDLLEKDIEALHGKEIAASAIEDLVASYKEREEALRRDLTDLQGNINFQRAQYQAAWVREQEEHTRQVAQRDTELNASRAREAEAYAYAKQQERARADQEFQNKLSDLRRANELKQADLERGWAQREAALKAAEDELTQLRTRVAGIQNEIDAAAKKEVAIVTNALSRDHKHATELAAKDFAAKETVANAKIASLQEQLNVANTTIASLNSQLATAQEKVAKIAGDALSAASGRQALAEVQSFVSQSAANGAKKS